MDDEKLDDIAHNILTICNVKIRSPVMTQELKDYISELENNIKEGKL
jgi:hypothetical protein